MKESPTLTLPTPDACTGFCEGCGKTHIKIFGKQDHLSQQLAERVHQALASADVDGKVVEISDPNTFLVHGIEALPALMIEGELVAQGYVPDIPEITRFLSNKTLLKSKLFRLRTVSVPVDMSDVSANAMLFAWEIAQLTGSQLEIVYAMDSIFEGSLPSASGFLSGYTKTMQTELDTFISETMRSVGVQYIPPGKFDSAPVSEPEVQQKKQTITSKVIYGAPDIVLAEYSRKTDLLVMGSTGRGGIAHKLFGSVSIEVSKNAHCPVLFVPKDAPFKGFKQMLYASDFDSLNELSVQQVVAFARNFDAQVHFVHVGPGGEQDLQTQYRTFEASYAKTETDQPFIFAKIVNDEIVGGLYEYAYYHRVDLLVFITHHRSFWDNILHKSITNEALSSTGLPVLVMHSDDDIV